MLEWLLSPIDPDRAHDLSQAVAYHGRIMSLAWGLLAPLSVIIARFFKVLPGQDWPRELDNRVWWRSHWIGQTVVFVLTLAGLALILTTERSGEGLHRIFGYGVVALLVVQVLLGVFRGSKGGPTDASVDGDPFGDHYNMTKRRLVFEGLHKTLGYLLLGVAVLAMMQGLWVTNAPRWMWGSLVIWWVSLVILWVILQRKGWAMDTYQAIWGPDPKHPGNRRGLRQANTRQFEMKAGDADVRRD